jgi:phosphate acetyltransferase
MKSKSIFIASTGQNIGKTTTSLGLLHGLKKRYNNVGFIKPIGQTLVDVEGIKVDKDVLLFKDCFSLRDSYQDMGPVLLPKGFTRNFLDGKETTDHLKKTIIDAHSILSKNNDFVLIEGTGHTAVGSIIGLNNAQVAKALNADMIIVASGGLGSSFDELMLNIALCQKEGARIRGIILNKVIDAKRDMILNYYPKALASLNIPLLGVIPYNTFLSTPCMKDFEILFDSELFSGDCHHFRHFKNIKIADAPLNVYRDDPLLPKELIIVAATRQDVILATLAKYWNEKTKPEGIDLEPGLILTGKVALSQELKAKIQKTQIPALYTPLSSYKALEKITSLSAKTRLEDKPKIIQAIQLVEQHIDFEKL